MSREKNTKEKNPGRSIKAVCTEWLYGGVNE